MSTPDETSAASSTASRTFLFVLVTVTGATVLALEVLGTRVIGTHYGSSLYVWAALLSVTLVCLAIGYAIGGKLADRFPREAILYTIVIVAGLTVFAVPFLTGVLVPLSNALGLAWGAIVSALIIFFLPLTLLATASPFVIRLLARRVEGMGSVSGTVYALSTVGSVAGVLTVSLWMIPTLGTRTSLTVCAAALIAIGACGLGFAYRKRAGLSLLLIALPLQLRPAENALPGELYRTESPFGELRVIQRDEPGRGTYRMLMVNGIMQTGLPLDIDFIGAGGLLVSDRYFLELLPYFYPDRAAGRRGVLIGLAGGMFARVMDFYDVDLTAVEIDAKVAELAKVYFGYAGEITTASGEPHRVDRSQFPLPPAEADRPEDADEPEPHYSGRAIIQDGRQYLTQHPQQVDFIVLDAYNSDTIPFHLITREFFELVKTRLLDDGILAINYIGRPHSDPVTDSLLATLCGVFGRDLIRAYRTRESRSEVQVMALFAFQQPMELVPAWMQTDAISGVDPLSYDLSRLREEVVRASSAIITDDLNPIDLARVAVAMEWREQTRAAVGYD